MPLARRLPKRGFRNPFREEYQIINLSSLERFAPGSVVDSAVLREAGLVEASRRGTWAYYRLVPEAIDALRGALGA